MREKEKSALSAPLQFQGGKYKGEQCHGGSSCPVLQGPSTFLTLFLPRITSHHIQRGSSPRPRTELGFATEVAPRPLLPTWFLRLSCSSASLFQGFHFVCNLSLKSSFQEALRSLPFPLSVPVFQHPGDQATLQDQARSVLPQRRAPPVWL